VQAFKEGATVVLDPAGTPQYFTIDSGGGTTWQTLQAATGTASGKSFKTTSTTAAPSGRARGSATDAIIVPDAAYFLYRAPADQSGNSDTYFYLDSIFPEKGLHPYTLDQYAAVTMQSARTKFVMVPDDHTRLKFLEGLLRYPNGDIDLPGKRLTELEDRVRALEQFANGSAAPAVGAAGYTPTIQDLLDRADA
jgi:hypothetical protein